jgi:hypothetical protein
MPIHATTPDELALAIAEHVVPQIQHPVAAPAEPVKPSERPVSERTLTLPGYLGPILLQH